MALTEVRALLETLEFGVTPCTVIAPGLRESVQMLLEKGALGQALCGLLTPPLRVTLGSEWRDPRPVSRAWCGTETRFWSAVSVAQLPGAIDLP